jgi:hypothetical membrane protein
MDKRTLSGLLFFLAAAQFALLLMAAEAIAPGYSIHDNAISDLGVIPETRLLFNSSLFFVGLLNTAAAFLLLSGRTGLLSLFAVSGIGIMGTAIFTLESGLHGIFALTAFIFANIQTIASAKIVRGPIRYVPAVLGIIGLAALALHIAGDLGGIASAYGPIGHGGSERMIVYPALLWLLAFGGYLMAYSKKAV